MVGRTVVVGDPCPWVAQSAEAFLSKIFACSYSIAGLNVLSGNPADHLVHRHTHRVVRGSLLVCGRPDGRLTALTTLEAATCLAVNQASSIQSIGGTCESITIGHNMSKLPLTFRGIFLESLRPQFLCEKLLDDADNEEAKNNTNKEMKLTATGNLKADLTSFDESDRHSSQLSNIDSDEGSVKSRLSFRRAPKANDQDDQLSVSRRKSVSRQKSSLSFRSSRKVPAEDELNTSKHRSSASLLGKFLLILDECHM